MAIDASDSTLYIADWTNHKIRKIDIASMSVSTFVGSGATTTEGLGVAATIHNPFSITLTPTGILYVAGYTHHRILQILPDGTQTFFVGSGSGSSAGA